MRAFVVTGPGEFSVQDVPPPTAAAGQAVIDIDRAGVCGTDAEFLTGEMGYLRQGHARYPHPHRPRVVRHGQRGG